MMLRPFWFLIFVMTSNLILVKLVMFNKRLNLKFWKDIPERTFVIDETNFFPRYFMGLDGILYENYGTEEKPMWEGVFDSDYEVTINNF